MIERWTSSQTIRMLWRQRPLFIRLRASFRKPPRSLPNGDRSSSSIAGAYIGQLQYERNFDQLIRFCEARVAQGHFASDLDKAFAQVVLACNQRLAGDTAGAKLTAEKARNTLELAYRRKEEGHGWRSRNSHLEESLSRTYALMGKKDLALSVVQRGVMLWPRAKDPVFGPTQEENLAIVQTMVGENKRAISNITRLLKTPYASDFYSPTGVTPALLRLDPIWDRSARRSRFPKALRGEATGRRKVMH